MKSTEVNVEKCIHLASALAAVGDNDSSQSYSLLGILMTLNGKQPEVKPAASTDQRERIVSAIVNAAASFFAYPNDEAFNACINALDELDALRESERLSS